MKDEWLTPQSILDALGPFDLDPCAPISRPWNIALHHYTIVDDGLIQPWFGFVWCNPPYGKMAKDWLENYANTHMAVSLLQTCDLPGALITDWKSTKGTISEHEIR